MNFLEIMRVDAELIDEMNMSESSRDPLEILIEMEEHNEYKPNNQSKENYLCRLPKGTKSCS